MTYISTLGNMLTLGGRRRPICLPNSRIGLARRLARGRFRNLDLTSQRFLPRMRGAGAVATFSAEKGQLTSVSIASKLQSSHRSFFCERWIGADRLQYV